MSFFNRDIFPSSICESVPRGRQEMRCQSQDDDRTPHPRSTLSTAAHLP